MSTKYKFRANENLYFVSFSVVYWIDIFIRPEYCKIIIDSLKFCQEKKGLIIYSWCIMSNHLHLIVSSKEEKLEDIMRDMKSHTSRALKKAIKNNSKESRKEWILWLMERAGKKNGNNKEFQLWRQDNHPIELLGNRMKHQKNNYIHKNPVKAGLVWKAEYYCYSSAVDYAGGKGLIEVVRI